MLSRKLQTLSRHLRERAGRNGGVILTPEEVVAVDGILRAMADEAASLYRQPVPAACRDALPPGVVDLMQRRRTRGTALAGHGPTGGAA